VYTVVLRSIETFSELRVFLEEVSRKIARNGFYLNDLLFNLLLAENRGTVTARVSVPFAMPWRVFIDEHVADSLALSFLPLDTELLLEALGFLRKAQLWTWKRKHLDCISVMILALFGAAWNLDQQSLCQLGNCHEAILMKPAWTEIQLPSNCKTRLAC